jgi:hypothetical protein
MKRTGFIALGSALFLLFLGVGLAAHFPAAAVTRAIEGGLNGATVLSVALAPVRITLTGLRSDRLTVREAGSAGGPPLIVLSDVRLPFSFSLWEGAPLRAALGADGRVSGFMAWNGSVVTIDEFSARLEDLALPTGRPGLTLKGRVSLSGQFRPGVARGRGRPEVPDGEFRGRAEAVEIAGIDVAGTKLPVTRLQDVEVNVRTGRTVQIERIEVRGDVQGTVQGSITPNMERPAESRMNLNVAATLRPGWVQETGLLRPILDGFFPGGRIEGALSGTAGAPNWAPARGPR